MSSLFDDVIEPDLERIPVLEAAHTERHNERKFSITQTLRRNVFTDFDRQLSRHLAATRGSGFPAFTVTVDVADTQASGETHSVASARLGASHHSSGPHALQAIAKRAFARGGSVDLTLHCGNGSTADDIAVRNQRKITTEDIEMLDRALGVCAHLGEPEFLDLSGDFDIIFATPPGGLKPMVLHLQNGTVSIAGIKDTSETPFECPIFAFAQNASRNRAAQSYLASVRHALVAEKEAAILSFRAMAEQRILDFDRVLAGRPLQGHRLDAAAGLIERLSVGLGETLSGLSEDARITALDWSAEIRRSAGGSHSGDRSSFAGTDMASARRAS